MNWRDIKLLMIEDDPDYIEFLADLISQSKTGIRHIKHATTLKQALEFLDSGIFDVALVDLHLPDSTGLDTLRKVREKAPNLPIVVLTAQQEEDYEEKALRTGAQEFLLKEEAMPRLLVRVMRYAMERMRAHIELRESQHRQKVILESAQAGLLMVDPLDHIIVDVNQTALDMMMRTREEVIGRNCQNFVCPNDKDNCPITGLGQTLERSERELMKADGSLMPILKTANTIHLEGRDLLLETFVDFSEAKEAREFLEAAKEKLVNEVKKRTRQLEVAKNQWEATFDAVPDLIAIIGRDQRIIRANRAMARKLNTTPADLVGQLCCMLMHDRDDPIPNCPHCRMLEDSSEHILEIWESKFDSDFLVSTSPLSDANGQIYASVHVARDISNLKKAERNLQGQVEFMNTIIETIPAPIFIKRADGVYTGCNKAFADFWGKPREEIIGRTVSDVAPLENAALHQEKDSAMFQNPGVQVYEAKIENKTLGTRDVVIYKAAYQQESGVIGGLVGVLVDITERKQMEDQLVRAQKLEAIGILAAGIAHEINTPTQYIHTNVEYLEGAFGYCEELAQTLAAVAEGIEQGKPSGQLLELAQNALGREDMEDHKEEVGDALASTLEGVERITKIVESMRYFSHPGTEEKEFLNLNEAVEHAITVSRNEWKYYAEVETFLEPDLPRVLGYAAPLNQVLLNLIVNAAQAISQHLGASPEKLGKISVTTKKNGSMVAVYIKDNGPGIPAEVLPKIFDHFFTTKEIGKGTGQGLALAHNVVVDKHSGTIDVETEEGKGTTFIVQLPIAPDGEMKNQF